MKRILAIAVMAGLSGCSTFGKQEFSCNGLPKGVTCKSAAEVYRETNAGFMPPATTEKDKGSKSDKKEEGEAPVVQPVKSADNQSAYLLPKENIPVPIITPPQVMRIWYAPWEDKVGDLHWPEYVFSEIESRKWVVGEKAEQQPLRFHPLEVRSRVKTQEKKPESLADLQKQ